MHSCLSFTFENFMYKNLLLISFLMFQISCGISRKEKSYFNDLESEFPRLAEQFQIDTLGIKGTIFPPDSNQNKRQQPNTTWTPTLKDILMAEKLLESEAKSNYPCLYKNFHNYLRQYVGTNDPGTGDDLILVQGLISVGVPKIALQYYDRFWYDANGTGCSVFYAEIDINHNICVIHINPE